MNKKENGRDQNVSQFKNSTLFKPTIAYNKKKDATLNERRKKLEKKQQEMKKMVAPTSTRFVTSNLDSGTQEYFLYDTRESSPTIEVKEYPRSKYDVTGNLKRPTAIDHSSMRHTSRRKRKERCDKINYEKSPVNNTNSTKYMVKHTYTKLEHDATGPKFTVIK
jgi:hypothetical protein